MLTFDMCELYKSFMEACKLKGSLSDDLSAVKTLSPQIKES